MKTKLIVFFSLCVSYGSQTNAFFWNQIAQADPVTQLTQAISDGDLKKVDQLLTEEATVNQLDKENQEDLLLYSIKVLCDNTLSVYGHKIMGESPCKVPDNWLTEPPQWLDSFIFFYDQRDRMHVNSSFPWKHYGSSIIIGLIGCIVANIYGPDSKENWQFEGLAEALLSIIVMSFPFWGAYSEYREESLTPQRLKMRLKIVLILIEHSSKAILNRAFQVVKNGLNPTDWGNIRIFQPIKKTVPVLFMHLSEGTSYLCTPHTHTCYLEPALIEIKQSLENRLQMLKS